MAWEDPLRYGRNKSLKSTNPTDADLQEAFDTISELLVSMALVVIGTKTPKNKGLYERNNPDNISLDDVFLDVLPNDYSIKHRAGYDALLEHFRFIKEVFLSVIFFERFSSSKEILESVKKALANELSEGLSFSVARKKQDYMEFLLVLFFESMKSKKSISQVITHLFWDSMFEKHPQFRSYFSIDIVFSINERLIRIFFLEYEFLSDCLDNFFDNFLEDTHD